MALVSSPIEYHLGYIDSSDSLLFSNIQNIGTYNMSAYIGDIAGIHAFNGKYIYRNSVTNNKAAWVALFDSILPFTETFAILRNKTDPVTRFSQIVANAQDCWTPPTSYTTVYDYYTIYFDNDNKWYLCNRPSSKIIVLSQYDNTELTSYNSIYTSFFNLVDGSSNWGGTNGCIQPYVLLDTISIGWVRTYASSNDQTLQSDVRNLDDDNSSYPLVPYEIDTIKRYLGYRGSVNDATADYEYNWDYTGSAIQPHVLLTLPNGYVLQEDTDYTISYSDNISVGFGKILITGIDLFYDSRILIFRINESDDPFSPGGSTDTDGGDGDFDDSSDTVPAPSLPSISALGSKITTIWVPTQSELQSFAEWFFSTNLLDIQTYIRTFANPIEFILGLSIVPLNVSYTTNEVVIGLVSSGVSMRRALTQFITFDCGTVNINEYWGAYLDYSPYTKIDLFLPFIGFRQLDADVVMGHTVNIKYNCDILSGACVAFVLVDGTVAYTFSGNMATQIPISGIDLTSIIATAATVATVGIGAVAAGVGAASGVSGSFLPMTDKIATVGKAIGSNLAEGASAVASKVIGTKQNIEKSGSISGSAGILSNKTPYLVINRPRQAVPDSQSHFTGYPGFINYKLQALSGYTVVEHIHLDNAPCTDDEAAELLTILKGGFVI